MTEIVVTHIGGTSCYVASMDAGRRADDLVARIQQVGSSEAWAEGSADLAAAAWDCAAGTIVADLGADVIRVWAGSGCMHPDHYVDRVCR